MVEINKAPLFRQGDSGPAVEDIQHLLNEADDDTWSKTAFLEEDGKFGPLTAAKVREYQKSFGLLVDGIVGPKTCASLFSPQADHIDQAQGIATTWTLIAKGAVQTLKTWVQSLQFGGPTPGGNLALFVDALRVHFHIDLPAPNFGKKVTANPLDLFAADEQLRFIGNVFEEVGQVLDQASIREGLIFYSVGFKQCELLKIGSISAGNRAVPTKQGPTRLICFPPSFAVSTSPEFFRTVHQRASTILHECCHYARPPIEGNRHIADFAYGLPAFAGQPNPRKTGHNYQQLTTDEAIHNAESYNLFAEHVTFLKDTRFGRMKDDLSTFECGSCAASG